MKHSQNLVIFWSAEPTENYIATSDWKMTRGSSVNREHQSVHPFAHLIGRDNIAIADGGECDERKVEAAQVALREAEGVDRMCVWRRGRCEITIRCEKYERRRDAFQHVD